ncbi:MAG TPA: ROK family protein [Gaiellaceae bacterium]|nr:ROK family protein [Gaiellaceae bacterium]
MKPCSPVVLGLDFGGTKIAVSVADRAGRRLGTTVVPTAPERGARRNLERGVDAARALLRDAAPDAALAGVGASTFGIPGPDGIRLAPAIPGWEELALEHELRRALACPHVRVANDVKAAATAELRLGALRGCGHGIYVNLGTGLAAALVAGGEVVLGANGAAGEIGYSLVDREGIVAAEHEVLEDVASGIGLSAAVRRRTGRRLSAADVFASGEFDDLVETFRTQLAFQPEVPLSGRAVFGFLAGVVGGCGWIGRDYVVSV